MASDINTVVRRYNGLVSNFGKAALHAKFPDDFEYYALALELVDPGDNLIDYFIFPVMPSNIIKQEMTRTTVKQTFNSTIVLLDPYFTPSKLKISGNFGRQFKFIVRTRPTNLEGFNLTDRGFTAFKNEFIPNVKTGYGCIKILQEFINKSKESRDGNTNKLYLHNTALGESYVVVPDKNPLSFTQNDKQGNMIWQYDLNLVIVKESVSADLFGKTGLVRLLATDNLQKAANLLGNDIKNFTLRGNSSAGEVIKKLKR